MNNSIKFWDDHIVLQHIKTELNWLFLYLDENNYDEISFIDIGGNVGKFYDEVSKKYSIKKCIIVEPSKLLFDYMKDKYKNNENVLLYNFGISNVVGNFHFDDSYLDYWVNNKPDNSINLGLSKINNTTGDTFFTTMDFFMENFNTIDPKNITFIKIDTENRDLQILDDLKKYLKKNEISPFILFENNFHNDLPRDVADKIIIDFCNECGYELINLDVPGDNFIKPIKSTIVENHGMEKIFSSIYENCLWGDNGHSQYHGSSGDGSSPEYNLDYIQFVKNFIKNNNIKSVSDGGCGDWRLGSSLFYDMDIEYNGYDVYSDLIEFLKKEYIKPKFNFIHLDIFNERDQIKSADLLLIKDVMQHWDDISTKEFVDWIIDSKKFKFVLITNCSSGLVGMTQEGYTGGWRGLSCEHPIFKDKGFSPVLKYHTKEVMLYQSNHNPMKEIYKLINTFNIDKKYWNYTNLSGEDYTKRSKPGPYIKLTIKIAKMLGLKNFVEIGSTRFAVSNKCIEYYNKNNDAFNSPPCCTDGHCGFFFGEEGFNVNTVDIDINCENQIRWSYYNIGKEFPDNIKINIPKDGIEFLNEFDGQIDVLYLDGWDVGTPNYALRHLEAYIAAKNKLSDVHLILIDDTDFSIPNGGKDYLLSPYLIEKGYIPLFNGRQTLFINTTNITSININDGGVMETVNNKENNMDFELTEFPKVILSLSTTPNRLKEEREGWGVKQPIEKLLNLSYPNYEINFNIPYVNHKTNEEYVIPQWLIDLSTNNDKLKIFRCNDYGSITKIVPTILRIDDPETILITVDDDLIYDDGFIEYHLKKQKIYPDSALGFAGIGAYDGSCHLCTTLSKDTKIKILEGYKTASYIRKFFKEDFFTDFVGKTWNDDLCISAYLGKHNIPKIVMNYNKDNNFNARVESFPIIKVIPNENSGCYLYRINSVDDNHNEFYNKGFFN